MDGRLRAQWDLQSHLMATVYNAAPGRKSPVRPGRINPYRGLLRSEPDEVVDLMDVFGLE